MRAWIIVAALLVSTAAGCVGGNEDAGQVDLTEAVGAAGTGDDVGPAGGWTNLSFASGETVDETRWENGTFHVREHSFPKGVATGIVGEYDADRRVIDVTDMVPTGVPVIFQAEIHAELGRGDVDLWLTAPEGEVWASDYDTPYGGYSRIRSVIVHETGGSLELNVRYDEIDDSESFDYTLEITSRADPSVVPPGVPVAVELPAGDTLELTPVEGFALSDGPDGLEAMLWGPDDTYLGRLTEAEDRTTFTVAGEVAGGEHVVMAVHDSPAFRVQISNGTGTDAPLRPLTQSFYLGPGVETDDSSEVTWTFELEAAPIQVGIFTNATEVSDGLEARLVGPSETILESSIGGLWIGAGFGWLSPVGADGLAAGTYEATVAYDNAVGVSPIEANHVVVGYRR